MEHYVIYDKPLDHHNDWCVRRYTIDNRGNITPHELKTFDTLADARRYLIDKGLYKYERNPKDDATIVETWL